MSPDALVQQALTHHRAGDLSTAESLYQQALSLNPNHPDALHFLGTLAHQCHNDLRAIDLLTRAFHLKQSPRTLNNLGEAYRALDRLDEALNCFSTAARAAQNYAEAHQNMGVVLAQQLKLSAGLAAYDRAIELQPDNAEAHVNRALVYLQQGNFTQGLSEFEWRLKHPHYLRHFDQPQWDGRPLTNKTLLLWAEQGFGDTLQFARFIPAIRSLAPNILFECQAALLPLFQHNFNLALIPQEHPLPHFDLHCPLMSLAKLLRVTPQNLRAHTTPYLSAPPDRIAHWHTRLASLPGRKIGLAWSTNAHSPTARRRSCSLADLSPLSSLPNTTFISLQKGPAAADAHTSLPKLKIHDLSPDLHDFAETAAVIAHVDHIITVDTAIAHLAGALNKPVSILLPFASDWRWLLSRTDSPWYPTAKLYRQSSPSNWSNPITALLATL